MRDFRWPPTQQAFDELPLEVTRIESRHWWNLRWKQHAVRDKFLFASENGRFTPAGGTTPCIYLSPSPRTSFRELYGDKLYGAKNAGRLLEFSVERMKAQVFVQVEIPPLRVCDLTNGQHLEAVGIDVATVTAPAIQYPRVWAERILRHPAQFDGIQYENRHTKEVCVVAWARYEPRVAESPSVVESRLMDHVGAYTLSLGVGQVELFDEGISIIA